MISLKRLKLLLGKYKVITWATDVLASALWAGPIQAEFIESAKGLKLIKRELVPFKLVEGSTVSPWFQPESTLLLIKEVT